MIPNLKRPIAVNDSLFPLALGVLEWVTMSGNRLAMMVGGLFPCRAAAYLKCAGTSCPADGRWPSETGFQELVSNRPEAAMVKSRGGERFGKRHGMTVSGTSMGDEGK